MTNKITRRTPRSSGSTKTRRNQHGGGKHQRDLVAAVSRRDTAQRIVDNVKAREDREKDERCTRYR